MDARIAIDQRSREVGAEPKDFPIRSPTPTLVLALAAARVVRRGDRVLVGGDLRGSVVLPAAYVETNVELGYATTVHRAQGMTVDTAHALIDPTTATRELLYVAMTRGATANHVYVAQSESEYDEAPVPVATAVAGVLARTGAEQSATEIMRLAADAHSSLATLLKEYEAIAAHAVAIGAARWDRQGGRVLHVVPRPSWQMPADYLHALRQREELIDAAATASVSEARASGAAWVREFSGRGERQPVSNYRV